MEKTQKTKKTIIMKKILPVRKVTTVHMDITKRLEYISLPLYTEVKKVLQKIRTKELNVEVHLNKGSI